jgi:tRNA modification GTPase
MSAAATIFALSSAPGLAGVAVLRVSGPAAFAALASLGAATPPPRQLARRSFAHPVTGEVIDHGLAVAFPGPASFTGEDVAELHVHGGRAVQAAMLDALGACPGLRLAEPGEFTRRAFHNGKLDLAAAEGLADLLAAETEAQRRQALRQASGALGQLCEDWRARLIGVMSLIEATLDFADEGDVGPDVLHDVPTSLNLLAAEMNAILGDAHRGEVVREGYRVVLAGAPNAGKSSLLNALARRDVAIVSPEAGTTRDVIEVKLDLGGLAVVVSDTAGIRAPESAIEADGIERTMREAGKADLVLWLVDAADPALPTAQITTSPVPVLLVANKSDLACAGRPVRGLPMDAPRFSARTGRGLPELIALLTDRARAACSSTGLVSRARQRTALAAAVAAIEQCLAGWPDQLELRAEDLRQAATALGRITGKVDVEDVLDRVFAGFCIGK